MAASRDATMQEGDVANSHQAGATPSLASVRDLGYDVRWMETYDRHRQYQVVDSSGDLVGDGATDDNYLHGFQTIDAAIVWLTDQAEWDTAVATAGGLTEGDTVGNPLLLDADQNIIGIGGTFSFPSESRRV